MKNAQYRMKTTNELKITKNGNFADQITAVEELQNSNTEFIQMIIRKPQKVPCIILYTENQIIDIVRFCCSRPTAESTVLGIDKTYNLCDLHVTVSSFKNLSLFSKNTLDHPIFLGPFFLHGNSDADTFFEFFHHLSGKLKKLGIENMPMVGSDDEKALKKAVQLAFPQSPKLSCVRHLKQNVNRFLQNKIGMKLKEKNMVLKTIFGDNGVINADDDLSLEFRLAVAEHTFPPEGCSYFESIKTILQENYNASQTPTFKNLKTYWTNNNSESMNHVIKQKIQWKPCNLVELIENLHELVKQQYKEARRALVGYGKYELCTEFSQFKLTPSKWVLLTTREREKIFLNFLSSKKPWSGKFFSISNDGKKKVIFPKHKGKKPGQRKRCRSVKTTTVTIKKT